MIIIVHLAPLIGNNHCFQQTLVIILIYGGKTKTTQKWRKKCQTIQNENIKCLVKFIYFIHFSSLHWQFKQKFDHENKCGIFFGWHKNTSFVKLVSIMKIAANVEFWWILNSKLLNIWKGGKTRSILSWLIPINPCRLLWLRDDLQQRWPDHHSCIVCSLAQFEHLAAVALSYTWVFKLNEYFVELNTGILGILESGYDLNTNS